MGATVALDGLPGALIVPWSTEGPEQDPKGSLSVKVALLFVACTADEWASTCAALEKCRLKTSTCFRTDPKNSCSLVFLFLT